MEPQRVTITEDMLCAGGMEGKDGCQVSKLLLQSNKGVEVEITELIGLKTFPVCLSLFP